MFPDTNNEDVNGPDKKYDKDYEVEIHTEDLVQQAKTRHRQEAMRKLKRAKRPKGHYMCPDDVCHYTNEWEEKIAIHVASRHQNSEYAAKAKEAIKIFLAKKQEKDREEAQIRKLEKAARKEADEIRAERALKEARARHKKRRDEIKTENMVREMEEAERKQERELLLAMGMQESRNAGSDDDQEDDNDSRNGREDQSDRGRKSPDRGSRSTKRSRKPRKTGRGKHGGGGSEPPSSEKPTGHN